MSWSVVPLHEDEGFSESPCLCFGFYLNVPGCYGRYGWRRWRSSGWQGSGVAAEVFAVAAAAVVAASATAGEAEAEVEAKAEVVVEVEVEAKVRVRR